MKLIIKATLLLTMLLPVSVSVEAKTNKGCIPTRSKDGCAGRGAPVAAARQWLVVALGCRGNGFCGYVANDLKVGENTSMVLQKPAEGFKKVTVEEIISI